MKKKGFRTENLGGSFNIDSNGMSIIGDLIVRRNSLTKSHSIIALNLQTVDDVEQVIRQCEALKGQMQGGLDGEVNISRGEYLDSTTIDVNNNPEFIKPDQPDLYKAQISEVIVPASVVEKG